MAIAIDATSYWVDGGATQDPFTGSSITPPNGSKILVCGSSFATSGDDNSQLVVSGTVLTWTRVAGAFLDQLNFGLGCAPPPIAFYIATGTGVAITITDECVDGLGFAHVQGVWVLTGAHATTPVIDADTFTSPTAAASITLTATAAGQLALFGMCDWDNHTDTPVKSDVNMTTRYALQNADIQCSYRGDMFSTGAGSITVGTNVLSAPQGTNAVAVLIQAAAADVTVNAGVASGTGASNAATAAINPSTGVSAASGAALSAAGSVSTNSGVAVAAGSAFNAQVLVENVVNPGVALGAGAALGAGTSVVVNAGVAGGTGQALSPSIEGGAVPQLYTFGPCTPWVPIWPRGECASVLLNPEAPGVTGSAVTAASEVLYHLTAQRFGTCAVKLRPCRRSCFGNFPWWTWWEYGTYPQPYWWAGTWYNLACNSCPNDSCSCVALEETTLPGPVVDITEVKINGTVLTRNVDYRLDDYRKLVRLGGALWPFCQNMNLEDTEQDTWSVTAEFGEVVPVLGQLAVGELALEFVKYLVCEECQLPGGVVDISRQGISMTIANLAELFNTGFLNLRMCDMFIQAANPKHLQARSAVYDLDGPQDRAVGTW